MNAPARAHLTSSRLLARNIALNVAGGLLPAIAVLLAVPILVRAMGDARFGILALAWTTVGYFSLFDLGIGRALTHAVAQRLGERREHEVAEVVWSALALLAPIALVGTAVLFALAPWLAERLLQVPPAFQGEARLAFQVLAFAIPVTALAAVLRGVLEATQRFGIVNALRAPYGLLTYLGPLAVLPFSRSVVPAILVLTVGRALLAVAYFAIIARTVPTFGHVRGSRQAARSLLRFGGWMTLSNVLSVVMDTADRFVVAAVLSVTVVTYYATPHELVTKMWLFTAAVHPVFFPAFATSATFDRAHTARLFDRCLRATFAALFLPTFLIVLLAPEILRVWLGAGFASQSTGVLQVLAIAVFVNTLGQASLTLVQSLGRPDLTGKFYLAELPVYALLLWWLMPRFGILGVALAWAIRALVDAALLLVASRTLLHEASVAVRRMTRWLLLATPAVAAAALAPSPPVRVAIAATATLAWGGIVWWAILTPQERMSPVRVLSAATPGD